MLSLRRVLAWGACCLWAAAWPAQGQVVFSSAVHSMYAGTSCQLSLRLEPARGEPAPAPPGWERATEGWRWEILEGGGRLDPHRGVYWAPEVEGPRLVRIHGTSQGHAERTAEARILVLPYDPFDLVGKVLGPGWMNVFSARLPFLNRATGQRYGQGSQVAISRVWEPPLPVCYAGYGLPCLLSWRLDPMAQDQLLSCGEGAALLQEDVSGTSTLQVTAMERVGRFTVEALRKLPGSDVWQSKVQEGCIHLRGLVPHAGHGPVGPGHEDGRGLSARFLEPFGVGRVRVTDEPYGGTCACLVSDPRAHVIRMVTDEGEVTTPWGQAGQAGHRDAFPSLLRRMGARLFGGCGWREDQGPRFNGPTFLAPGPPARTLGRERKWERCHVADTGNHVIRVLYPDGRVNTLAGSPGQAGYRDGYATGALFDTPQGLAEDGRGNLYVADQGNGVLRRIAPDGMVTTVAGRPGIFGDQDGPGQGATFTALRGLALSDGANQPQVLYAVDGHAIRRVSLPEGEVATVLGVVAVPGFKTVLTGTPEERLQALGQPCLANPCGVLVRTGGLLITDQGNHSIRWWSFPDRTLATVVGDPSLAETRWGLLLDGLEAPLDERYAGLDSPRTLAACAENPEAFVVATGCCLGWLSPAMEFREGLSVANLQCSAATLEAPCLASFLPLAANALGSPTPRPIHYAVDFFEPDGTLAERVRGQGTSSALIQVPGQFGLRGTGKVVVRCVTDQGVSAGARQDVAIR